PKAPTVDFIPPPLPPTVLPPPPLPVPLVSPTFIDTKVFDTFPASNGTVTSTNIPGTLTYGIDGETISGITVLGVTHDVSKSGPYGTLYLNSATGAFIFVPNDAEINALTAPTTQTYVLTVSNGTLSTSQNLTINILGADDAPTLQPVPGQTITDAG